MRGNRSLTRKFLAILYLLNLVLFGCTRQQVVLHQPKGKNAYAAAKPKSLSDSIRSVYRTSALNYSGSQTQTARARPLSTTAEKMSLSLSERLERAQKWSETGLLWQAAAEFESILSKEPESARAHYGLAQIWGKMGHSGKALQAAQAAAREQPAEAQYWLFLAEVFVQSGDDQNAHHVLSAALEHNPDNLQIWTRLGVVRNRLHEYDQARSALEWVLALAPENREAREALAVAHLFTNDESRALRELLSFLSPAEAWNWIGSLYLSEERWSEARRAFVETLKVDPENVFARGHLADAESHLTPPTVVLLPSFAPPGLIQPSLVVVNLKRQLEKEVISEQLAKQEGTVLPVVKEDSSRNTVVSTAKKTTAFLAAEGDKSEAVETDITANPWVKAGEANPISQNRSPHTAVQPQQPSRTLADAELPEETQADAAPPLFVPAEPVSTEIAGPFTQEVVESGPGEPGEEVRSDLSDSSNRLELQAGNKQPGISFQPRFSTRPPGEREVPPNTRLNVHKLVGATRIPEVKDYSSQVAQGLQPVPLVDKVVLQNPERYPDTQKLVELLVPADVTDPAMDSQDSPVPDIPVTGRSGEIEAVPEEASARDQFAPAQMAPMEPAQIVESHRSLLVKDRSEETAGRVEEFFIEEPEQVLALVPPQPAETGKHGEQQSLTQFETPSSPPESNRSAQDVTEPPSSVSEPRSTVGDLSDFPEKQEASSLVRAAALAAAERASQDPRDLVISRRSGRIELSSSHEQGLTPEFFEWLFAPSVPTQTADSSGPPHMAGWRTVVGQPASTGLAVLAKLTVKESSQTGSSSSKWAGAVVERGNFRFRAQSDDDSVVPERSALPASLAVDSSETKRRQLKGKKGAAGRSFSNEVSPVFPVLEEATKSDDSADKVRGEQVILADSRISWLFGLVCLLVFAVFSLSQRRQRVRIRNR